MSFVLLHVVLFSEIIGVKLGIAGERLGGGFLAFRLPCKTASLNCLSVLYEKQWGKPPLFEGDFPLLPIGFSSLKSFLLHGPVRFRLPPHRCHQKVHQALQCHPKSWPPACRRVSLRRLCHRSFQAQARCR